MAVYDILNEFQYKFEDEEDFDKKWKVFGAPQDTLQRIEKQQGFLEKEKERFIAQMQNQQIEFQ